MTQNNLKLQDIEFIAGSDQTLEFMIYGKDGELLNMSGAKVTWYLYEIGNPYDSLVKKSTDTGDVDYPSEGVVDVRLTSNDTLNLFNGKYEHELTIVQQNGRILKPCYGFIRIKACVK